MDVRISPIPYADCPGLGPGHLLSRLVSGDCPDFPLLGRRIDAFSQRLALFDPDATPRIIAGQQPCLLTGPIYTVLKAATAVRLSMQWSAKCRRTIQPTFWVASEDHDVLEVNRIYLRGRKLVCPFQGTLSRGTVPPVGAISLDHEKERIIENFKAAYMPAPFGAWLVDLLGGCRFTSYATLFADLLEALFEPWQLAMALPDELRQRTGPVLADLVENWPDTQAAFAEGSEKLSASGFIPPLTGLIFFEFVNGFRMPVAIEDNRMHLSHGKVSFQEAARIIREEPDRFSPGAALRPVLQDAALPITATVAGPTELLYLWQVQPLYRVAGVTPSLLTPRMSLTFVPADVQATLETGSHSIQQLFALLHDIDQGLSTITTAGISAIADDLDRLLASLGRIETSANAKWLSRSVRTLEKHASKTINRLRRETLFPEGQLRALSEQLFPRGKLQERTVNIFDFLSLYGPAWLQTLCERLDPMAMHHILASPTRDNNDHEHHLESEHPHD